MLIQNPIHQLKRIFPACLFFLLCFPFLVFAQSGYFKIINSSGVARKADAVIISRESLKSMMEIPAGKVPVVSVNDRIIASQTDDLTQDGQWDELVFQIDVDRNSSLPVRIKWEDPADVPLFTKSVNCLMAVKESGQKDFLPVEDELMPDEWHSGTEPKRYRNDGPVWESESIAFRHFFDERNFVSVLGKQSPRLIADTLDMQAGSKKPEKWGMEVLPFDSGFGAGGFAIKAGDKWHTLAKAGSVQFRRIAAGPVRAVFDLLYEGWTVEDHQLNVRKRISIFSGKSFYKTELQVSGFPGELEFAAGISLLPGSVPSGLPSGKDLMAIFWRQQSENSGHGVLSLGILLSGSFTAESEKGNSLPFRNSCFGLTRITSGQSIDYLTFAAWEKTNERFGNTLGFRNLIQKEADCLENPLRVSR